MVFESPKWIFKSIRENICMLSERKEPQGEKIALVKEGV